MKLNKVKKIKSSYPILIFEDFINKDLCNHLKKSIISEKNYDDFVMNGRNRINKGSNKFESFINSSSKIKNFYNMINNFSFYRKCEKMIKKYYPESKWKINNKIKNFSKTNYGLQKGSKLTKSFSKSKNVVNLDIDFSVSSKGYYRSVHRDRETRVINFLIYLNSLSSKDGGAFEVYKSKKVYKNANQYPRFPSNKDVQLEKKLLPKKGQLIIFKSTPDSYHAAEKFVSRNKKRVFLYGSFSLNKEVVWKKFN